MYYRKPEDAIYKFLDNVGDGSGYKNFNHENSASAAYGAYVADEACLIERMIVSMEDTSGMQAQEYGNLGAALTTGWKFLVLDTVSATACDLTDGVAITTNALIGQVCYDVDVKTWGAGNEVLVARWTFGRAGQGIYLPRDYRIKIPLADDFTGLITHYFQIQGYKHYQKGAAMESVGLVDQT
jgi:hypothetical protein